MEQCVLITKQHDTCYTASCFLAPTQTFDTSVLILVMYSIIITLHNVTQIYTMVHNFIYYRQMYCMSAVGCKHICLSIDLMYLSISILCSFILQLHYILKGNITPLT